MKKVLAIVSLCALAACSDGTKQELACTGETIKMAFNGDFSQWALPDFIPGNHLKGGEYAACMPKPVNPWQK